MSPNGPLFATPANPAAANDEALAVLFAALLAGKSEEEIWGPDEPTTPPELPGQAQPSDEGRREGPRPLPRPGLAGGGLEARGLDLPEKPELA